jgi:hypothetical protein
VASVPAFCAGVSSKFIRTASNKNIGPAYSVANTMTIIFWLSAKNIAAMLFLVFLYIFLKIQNTFCAAGTPSKRESKLFHLKGISVWRGVISEQNLS